MLEAGTVRSKNTRDILMKNLTDACIVALVWWAVGAGVAGGGNNGFIGGIGSNFFLSMDASAAASSHSWLLGYVYAAASCTIVSGAIAERTQHTAYMISSSLTASLIYPVAAHWFWAPDGWLNPSNPAAFIGGAVDVAGGGVVHLTGGLLALVAAAVSRPRDGRFNPLTGAPEPIPGHSSVLVVLGTFFLWVGWIAFNLGSVVDLTSPGVPRIAAKVATHTVLAGATASLVTTAIERWRHKHWSVTNACNGVLAGLVSITAGCATVPTWASVVIGLVGGVLFSAASRFVLHVLKVDDVVDAFAVHGACGLWSLLAAGLFSSGAFIPTRVGAFMGGDGTALGAAFVGALSILVWAGGLGSAVFLATRRANLLRVDREAELVGIDAIELGGCAYGADPDAAPDGMPRRPPPYSPAAPAAPAARPHSPPGNDIWYDGPQPAQPPPAYAAPNGGAGEEEASEEGALPAAGPPAAYTAEEAAAAGDERE